MRYGWERGCTGLTLTPAGILQAFPLHVKPPAHMKWSRDAIRGLTYMMTDKGPQRQWVREISRTGCVCDGWTPQNAAHLHRCPWVGVDGMGRSREHAGGDEEDYAEVARFLG